MVGVAVKVTDDPEQIVVAGVVILNEGVTEDVTVIVTALDVAGLPVTPLRLEVMTQVTTCPLVRVDVVKVGLLVPALTPPTFH